MWSSDDPNVHRYWLTVAVGADRKHALAALALHGQPFGFSEADIGLLGRLADYAHAAALPDGEHSPPLDDALATNDLLYRIAALLPPPPAP